MSVTNITVRRAKPDDSGVVIKLLLQIAGLHHESRPDIFKAGSKKYTEEEFTAMLEDENRPIFVAVGDRDDVLGYCFCEIHRYEEHSVFRDHVSLYIDDLCVDESLRGQGVGRVIFAAVKEYAGQIGADYIDLNVWESNESALRFYESCGFTTRSRRLEMRL